MEFIEAFELAKDHMPHTNHGEWEAIFDVAHSIVSSDVPRLKKAAPLEHKMCPNCGEIKKVNVEPAISEFDSSKTSPDGYAQWCKECSKPCYVVSPVKKWPTTKKIKKNLRKTKVEYDSDREKICDYLKSNPGSTINNIAKSTCIPKGFVGDVIDDWLMGGKVVNATPHKQKFRKFSLA